MNTTEPVTADGDWRQILAEPGERAHTVQLYTELAFLTNAVTHYAGTGLARGEAVIFIAAPRHREAFLHQLTREGFEVELLRREGQLTVLDAAETLSRFMTGGRPDRTRFTPLIGEILDRAAARYPRVRAYGEMVNLLWEQGELDPALELEDLWNDLGSTRAFSLHCAYAIDNFDPSSHCCALKGVRHSHSHLIPVEDYGRLDVAVTRALADVLGPTEAIVLKSVLQARHRSGAQMPGAQAALLGLTEVLPSAAEAVLPRARRYYGAAEGGMLA
jgi:hypothetical protein